MKENYYVTPLIEIINIEIEEAILQTSVATIENFNKGLTFGSFDDEL